MNTEAITIGAYEAKSHFSEIVGKVTEGIPHINTMRGKPAVKLTPVDRRELSFRELSVKAEALRKRIKSETGDIDVQAYINEGRKPC
jgi:prevent-host-death family protein